MKVQKKKMENENKNEINWIILFSWNIDQNRGTNLITFVACNATMRLSS